MTLAGVLSACGSVLVTGEMPAMITTSRVYVLLTAGREADAEAELDALVAAAAADGPVSTDARCAAALLLADTWRRSVSLALA